MTLCLLLGALVCTTQAVAQTRSEIKITTSKQYGESLSIWPKTSSKAETIMVDWGDGNEKAYNIDPNGMPFMSKVSGKIVGDTIRIFAKLVSLDCAEAQITSLEAIDQLKMTSLTANNNELTSDKLILDGAANLEQLNLTSNDLSILNLSEFQELQIFYANDNARLGAVLFPEYSENLRSISMSKCDISHFYPVDLPVLESLSIADCALTEIEISNHYPELKSLDVSGNYLTALDVTQCKLLNTLKCGNNQLTEINVSQNNQLLNFFCENNKIRELNLKNNPLISSLSCDHNELTQLNVAPLPNLIRLSCDNNQLTRLDVSQNTNLNRLTCKDNQLEFLDFANNPRMDYIDCRNNSKMTSCTVNYMFSTLLARYRDAYSPNLLVEGCNAEHADMSEVNSAEMKWKTDVVGDGSATCEPVALTAAPAQHGTYTLAQPTQYGKNYQTITDLAKAGTPIKITTQPEAEYAFDYALVNGVTVQDTLFVVHEAAKVEIMFKSTKFPEMALNTTAGQELSFSLSAPEENTTITIDWGDGVESTQTIGTNLKRFDGVAAGATLKIKGHINEADFSSYPGMGMWDNKFTSLTLKNCEALEALNVYMNEIGSLDVSNCPNLQILDCSYTGISEINVSQNPKLVSLNCYGNQIATLDVSKNPNLVELNAKSNLLTELNLSANPALELLDVQNNKLSAIDVTQMESLAQLYVSANQLTEINVSQNPDLYILNVSGNKLKTLDVTQNLSLGKLLCADNQIAELDLSNQLYVFYVDCQGNKMTACALTDLYYSLPEYPELTTPLKGHTLWVKGNNPETSNDAEHAESILATGKGWVINYDGDGSGCEQAYVTVLTPQNGTIEVFTANGEKVRSGTKVAKHSELTVKATPDAGYMVGRMTANGKELVDGKFTITRSTDVAVRFELSTGIDHVDAANGGVDVAGGHCIVTVATDQPVTVSIFSLEGKLIKQSTMDQSGEINVPSGTYIVKTVAGNKMTSKVVGVR